MLESLMSPISAKTRTWELFFIGALYYSVACLLSLWVFKEYASIVVLLFTVISMLPLLYNIIRLEEEEASEAKGFQALVSHKKYFALTMYFFGGVVFASTLWYVFTPTSIMHSLYEAQIKTITGISLTGKVSWEMQIFVQIFFNNLKVLIFCILFSFIYGSGALFILTWNASVIGVAIGHFIRSKLAAISSLTGFEYLTHYFGAFAVGLTKYLIHGIPEILAYFVGGLAGGIISVGVIKKEFREYKFSNIIWDVSNLIILSIAIVFIAAILEVWVTPMIFGHG